MDLAFSFQMPQIVYKTEGMVYQTISLNHRLRFESSGFGIRNVCNTSMDFSKVHRTTRMKRTVAFSCSVNFCTYITRNFDSDLMDCSSRKFSRCSFENCKGLKRGVLLRCRSKDSEEFANGNGQEVDIVEVHGEETSGLRADVGAESNSNVDELKEMFQNASKELEVAQINSTMFEEKAQRISEIAIALKDKAENAWNNVNVTLDSIKEIVKEESNTKDSVEKATIALSLAEARSKVALSSEESDIYVEGGPSESDFDIISERNGMNLVSEKENLGQCKANLESCEAELRRLQIKKEELQSELDRLNEVAEKVQLAALKADEEVADVMRLAEQAVAFELEVTQHISDAEIALQKVEKIPISDNTTDKDICNNDPLIGTEKLDQGSDISVGRDKDLLVEVVLQASKTLANCQIDTTSQSLGEVNLSSKLEDQKNGKAVVDSPKEHADMSNNLIPIKKHEVQKDVTRDNLPPKASLSKSSRFFSASFFSFSIDGDESSPILIFHGIVGSAKKQLPKLIVGLLLLGAGIAVYTNRADKISQLFQQPYIFFTRMEEVSSSVKPLVQYMQKLPKKIKILIGMFPQKELNEEDASFFDMLWLLLASVIFVPIFQKIPGGSPVLGYLAAGILIGPYGLSIIRHVHGTKAIAEFGVVFLLFNIGLELSVERLSSMKKYVFGLGSTQVLLTTLVAGLIVHLVCGQRGPAAIVIGNGLALSSTAVVLQVLQERGENTSRHGRATFSVLLFQDLAVVVLLILLPLISPNSSKGGLGFQAIAEALGFAAIKAVAAITLIIFGGRLLLRPIYKQVAENQNTEIFSASSLLVILGTSFFTAKAGLSMGLGAFLAGLLLAETEFALQVESDITPYRGLLLGLFFMTVGMSIDPKLLVSNFPVIMGALGLLIGGKTILVALIGKIFGLSFISALRVGLLLAPGSEFAFVAFGEAVNQRIMSSELSSLLFLVVGISMALTPYLAAGGQLIASRFEQHDVRSLLPAESETDDLQDHIIICGFGRVGQIIAQLLSERLIPFVALDVRSDRVTIGRGLDLPVYFGDSGSREVLHKVGAERACAAAITLDTPGANYRTVWALSKYFPNVKTFVRAHDVDHGLNLEKAGATAVVPETLEPSLQLAAAVLSQAKLPMSEIASTINEFRSRHLSELTEISEASGNSLGYGFSRIISKTKCQPSVSLDENQVTEVGILGI